MPLCLGGIFATGISKEGWSVTEELRLLIELQEIDSAIVRGTELVNAIPNRVLSVEQPLRNSQAEYEKSKQRYEIFVKKKKGKEGLLDEVGEKIRKLKARVSEIKTNKEYQAYLKEIEAAEKEQRSVEDDILELMETIDTAHRDLSQREAKVKGELEKIDAFKKKLQEEVSVIEKELGELKLRREALVKGIDRELHDLYFNLLEAKRGLAVIEAKDEVCRGCNMNIPPQLFVEIKKNERIIQCPQCTRILYWKAEEGR